MCVCVSGFRRTYGRVTLGVHECIWNVLVVLLGLPTFDNTGSLIYPSLRVVYRSSVVGNRDADLKPTTLS